MNMRAGLAEKLREMATDCERTRASGEFIRTLRQAADVLNTFTEQGGERGLADGEVREAVLSDLRRELLGDGAIEAGASATERNFRLASTLAAVTPKKQARAAIEAALDSIADHKGGD